MQITTQTTFPTVSLYNENNICYQTFTAGGKSIAANNLQGYTYQRSVNTLSGSFSLTIKENMDTDETFLDKVHNLDVVTISELNKTTDFIGVITSISYTSNAQNLQRIITISGNSLEFLFEFLEISLDLTAMVITKQAIQEKVKNITINATLNNGNPVKVKDALNSLYKTFCEVANMNSELSNTKIIQIIDHWYGTDIFDVADNLEFKLPIASNMFSGDKVDYASYIQRLFPQNVYEFYGIVLNGKPKLVLREKQFTPEKWKALKTTQLENVSNYTITRTINEVYTYFYSYVQGSKLDSEFYARAGAGNGIVEKSNKVSKYGYKPLRATFVGYNVLDSNTKEQINKMQKVFEELNKKLKTWYENIDEMWAGTFTVILVKNKTLAKIAEKVNFLGGQFYVSGEDHQWRYGTSPQIVYHCERGGKYDESGKFKALENFSKRLADFEKRNSNGVI